MTSGGQVGGGVAFFWVLRRTGRWCERPRAEHVLRSRKHCIGHLGAARGSFSCRFAGGDEEQPDARVLSWFWGRMGVRDGVGVLVVRAYQNDRRHG